MISPELNDVLFGKGHVVQRRPGNQCYRRLVSSLKADYDAAPKSMKSIYGYQFVDHVHNHSPPGRFLKRDKDSGLWIEVSTREALLKVRQALRDSKPKHEKDGKPVPKRILWITTEVRNISTKR